MSTNKVDVIIIGAGISGLSSAKLLTEQGLNVIVLEARDRVGGRTYTVRDPSYGYSDMGGAYVGPTQRRVARMAKEYGLEFYNVNIKEKTVLSVQGSWSTYYGTVPPIWNPIKAMDVNSVMLKLDKMSKSVPLNAPWKAPKAKLWDSMTFQQFIDSVCWTQYAKKLMTIACVALTCVEPCEVSLLFVLWYVASGQGVQRIFNIENGAQEKKIVGGAMQISEKIASQLGDSQLKLSSAVVKVIQTTNDVQVYTENGDKYQADYVISAMPQALLNRVRFEPPLLPLKLQLIQRMPMGSIIKTVMFYEKAFWREKKLCGQAVADEGPVHYCMDDTKADGSCPAIMGFVLANRARDLLRHSVQERKKLISSHYAKVFKCDDFLKPTNYLEKNWMEDEYSGGCYVSALPPGVLTQYGPMLRRPHLRLHFAGTESATFWAGYMDGAIQAGERAAREILCAMDRLPACDINQDEPPVPGFSENPFPLAAIERLLPSVSTFLWVCGAALIGILGWLIAKEHLVLSYHIKY